MRKVNCEKGYCHGELYKGVNTGMHLGGILFIELTANRTMWGASNQPFFATGLCIHYV